MSAVLELPEISEESIALAIEERKHAVFFDVSWETYEDLLDLYPTRHNPKLFYNQGVLELMPLPKHDNPIRLFDEIFTVVAETFGFDWENFGSSTYKLEIFGRGFEPDSSYYLNENAKLMRGKEKFDLAIDPPPDLIFEVDVTSSSMNEFIMFSEFGVAEIWIYERNQLNILQLKKGEYVESAESLFLPKITGKILTNFINESRRMPRPEWREKMRERARQNLK